MKMAAMRSYNAPERWEVRYLSWFDIQGNQSCLETGWRPHSESEENPQAGAQSPHSQASLDHEATSPGRWGCSPFAFFSVQELAVWARESQEAPHLNRAVRGKYRTFNSLSSFQAVFFEMIANQTVNICPAATVCKMPCLVCFLTWQQLLSLPPTFFSGYFSLSHRSVFSGKDVMNPVRCHSQAFEE